MFIFLQSFLIIRSPFSKFHHYTNRHKILTHTIRHTHTFGHTQNDIKITHSHAIRHTKLDTTLNTISYT